MNFKIIFSIKNIFIIITILSMLLLANSVLGNNISISADKGSKQKSQYYHKSNFENKIRIALENRQITQKEANKKLEYFSNKDKYTTKKNISSSDLKTKIQIAVKLGKISQEEADIKLGQINE